MDPQSNNDQSIPMAQPPQSAAPPLTAPIKPAETASATATGPSEAADSEVIETEWIIKAKQVVAATRDDPYRQVKQLNQLKADYMQKRYNKIVKVPEA